MDYSKWKRAERSPISLRLDAKNPRIPPSSKPLTPGELIVELVQHEDVYALAANIKANGYFPSEPLIAIREDDRFVVVEGNRRLAACKLLLNPDLAPPQSRPRFRTLVTKFLPASIKKVPVLVAPNRQATVPLVIARHTSPQIEKWEPAMKASFYHRMIRDGMTLQDVAAQFSVSMSETREALYSHNLYEMACRLELDADVSTVVRNPRQFSLTNLVRVFESPYGREFFGVQLEEDGTVRGKIRAEEFKKGFSRLVRDLALETVDSRTLNKPADIEKYLSNFEQSEKPDLGKSGGFDSTNFLTDQSSTPKAPPEKLRRKRVLATLSLGLIPKSFTCNTSNSRVQDLFAELIKLRPEKFPTSCGLAFRCFVELNTYLFLKGKKELPKIRASEQAKAASRGQDLSPSWSPTLSLMLSWIEKHGLISEAQVVKALRKVRDEDLFTLNLYAHNTTYCPSGPELRRIWKNSQEFVRSITE